MPYNYPTPEELAKQTEVLKTFNNAGYIGGTANSGKPSKITAPKVDVNAILADKRSLADRQGRDESPLERLNLAEGMNYGQENQIGEIPYDNQLSPLSRGDTLMGYAKEQHQKLKGLGMSEKDPSVIPLHAVLGRDGGINATATPISISNKMRGLSGNVTVDVGQKDGPNPATLSIHGSSTRRYGMEPSKPSYNAGATYERRFAEGGIVSEPQEGMLANRVPQDAQDQINGMMAKGGFAMAKGGKIPAQPKGGLPPQANQSTTSAIEEKMRQEFQKRGLNFDKFLTSAPMRYAAAKSLAKMGNNGDTILAHINPREAAMLKQMGGSGTINPKTGLPQFDEDPYMSISSGPSTTSIDTSYNPGYSAYDYGNYNYNVSDYGPSSSTMGMSNYDYFNPFVNESYWSQPSNFANYDYSSQINPYANYDIGPQSSSVYDPYMGYQDYGNPYASIDTSSITSEIAQTGYNLYGLSPESSIGQVSQFGVGDVSGANNAPTVSFGADVSGMTAFDPLTGAIADYTKSLEPASTPIENAANKAASPGILDLISNALVGNANAATLPNANPADQNKDQDKTRAGGDNNVQPQVQQTVEFKAPDATQQPKAQNTDIISSATDAIKNAGNNFIDYIKSIGTTPAPPSGPYGSQNNPILSKNGVIQPDPVTNQPRPSPDNLTTKQDQTRAPTDPFDVQRTIDFDSLLPNPPQPSVARGPNPAGSVAPAVGTEGMTAESTNPFSLSPPPVAAPIPIPPVPPEGLRDNNPVTAFANKAYGRAEDAVRGVIDDPVGTGLRVAADALPGVILGPYGALANLGLKLTGNPSASDYLMGSRPPSDMYRDSDAVRAAAVPNYLSPYEYANQPAREDFGIKTPNMEGVDTRARISNLMAPTSQMAPFQIADVPKIDSQFKLPAGVIPQMPSGGGGGGGGSPTAAQIAAAMIAQQKAEEKLTPVARFQSSGRQYVDPRINYYRYGYGPQQSFYKAEGGAVGPLNRMRNT